jgi:hypothetical protein
MPTQGMILAFLGNHPTYCSFRPTFPLVPFALTSAATPGCSCIHGQSNVFKLLCPRIQHSLGTYSTWTGIIFLVLGAVFRKFHGLEYLNILFPPTTDAGLEAAFWLRRCICGLSVASNIVPAWRGERWSNYQPPVQLVVVERLTNVGFTNLLFRSIVYR